MRRVLVLAWILLGTACSRDALSEQLLVEPDLSGSVQVSLTGTSDDGKSYVLRQATVELSGAAMLTLSGSATDERLSAPLPAGAYTLYLRDGFEVVELDPQGGSRAIAARLVTRNPQHLHVADVEDAHVKLVFEHAGERIVFGSTPTLRASSR